VGRRQLAEMMRQTFAQRRQIKEQQIRIARRRHLTPPPPSDPLLSAPPGLSCTRPVPQRALPGARTLVGVGIGAALAVLALGAWLLLGAGSDGDAPSSAAVERQGGDPREGSAAMARRSTQARPPASTADTSGGAKYGAANDAADGDQTEGAGPREGAMTASEPEPEPEPDKASEPVTFTVRVTHPRQGVSIRHGDRWHRGPRGRFRVERGDQPITLRVRARGYRERRVKRIPDRDREIEIVLERKRWRRRRGHRRTRRSARRDGLLRFEDLGQGARSRSRRPPRRRRPAMLFDLGD
jgi:hypothetical protein